MIQKLPEQRGAARRSRGDDEADGFDLVLWLVWGFVVITFAVFRWQSGATAAALVIQTLLVGLVGIIVLTLIEMRFEPERFVGKSGRFWDR
jgi:hypothetical protein